MNKTLHLILSIILIFLLVSCSSRQNKIDCPSFNTRTTKKFNNGINHFELKKLFKKKQVVPHRIKSAKVIHLVSSTSNINLSPSTKFQSASYNSVPINEQKAEFSKRKSETYRPKLESNKKISSKRKAAITKGVSIVSMAVIAGISIPILGSLTASIGLVIIFILDVLISLGVIHYYKDENPKLARLTGLSRLLYSLIFGIGITHHIAGNLGVFQNYWSAGLIVFGIHLIALGFLFHTEGGKKWVNYSIKSLLMIAGVGYIILNVGLFISPNPLAYTALIEPIFIIPQVLAEVLFAMWMILKGGKLTNTAQVTFS